MVTPPEAPTSRGLLFSDLQGLLYWGHRTEPTLRELTPCATIRASQKRFRMGPRLVQAPFLGLFVVLGR